MKPQQIFLLSVLALLLSLCFSCKEQDEKALVNKYLQQMIDAYGKHETIAYKEVNTDEEGNADTTSIYFEKNPSDTVIGFRFWASDNVSQIIYDGSQLYALGLSDDADYYMQKNEYSIIDENFTRPFPVVIGYVNSAVAYSNVFKLVQQDTVVVKTLLNDTTINEHQCWQIHLHFDNKRLYGDEYYDFGKSIKFDFDYTFFIDKKEHLLRQLTLSTSLGEPFITQYIDYAFDQPRQDIKWHLQDYEGLTEYVYVEYESLKEGEKMPAFKGKILGGEEVDQSYLKGKPTMLFFWFPGCGAGKMTYPVINNLVKKYPEITVWGIDIRSTDEEKILKYKEKEGLDFTIVYGDKNAFSTAFGVDACPTIFIFDKKGILVYTQEGYYDGLEAGLAKILDGIK